MRPHGYRLLLASAFLLPWAVDAQTAIGQWREHFPYLKTVTVLEANGIVYCATRNAVFSFDPASNEMTRLSKVNALSDVDITALGWNSSMGALLVGYANGNLDVTANGSTVNLSDIKRSNLIGDKRIYAITDDGPLAYLCCGFGVVVMDLSRQEVRDTWLIGLNAAQVQVNALAFHQDSIYAATDHGLFSAWREEANLAAFTNWHLRPDLPQQGGNFNSVVSFAGKLVANYSATANNADTVLYFDGSWQRLVGAYSNRNSALSASSDGQRLVVPHAAEVRQYDGNMQEVSYIGSIQGQSFKVNAAAPRGAGGVWIATDNNGLGRGEGTGSDSFFSPNGPRSTSAQRMDVQNGLLMVVCGAVAGNWTNTYSHEGIHIFKEGAWNTHRDLDDPLLYGVNNFGGGAVDQMAVAVDPNDPGHAYTGSWEEGVLEWRDGVVTKIWNATNSSLGTNGDPANGIVDIAGFDFDADGNLWVSNANCNDLISVRKKDGNWKSFSPGNLLNSVNIIGDIVAGHNHLKWVVRPRGNGILVFTDNGTIDDTGDDQFKVMNTFENQGKLPTLDVYSIAEDKDDQVWVGTGKGVAVFYNPDAVFSGENFDCQQILIEQDGNVQILLETETVNAIVVDGANRKWLATQNSGVYLVSADGTRQLEHFTAENSPLPSNNITCMTLDGQTGEIFFGTDQGIISYRGEAIEESKEATCASVFPNPVHATYQGPVAITGLRADSDVRITDVAGNLVYKTTSLGGQAIWPATNLSGERVATGVYMVLASDPTGDHHCNTRVLVVH